MIDDGIRRVAMPRDADASRRYRDGMLAVKSAVAPTPVVLVAATSPSGNQLPRGASTLIRAAQDAGWRVRATYALAEVPAWRRHLATVARDGAHWRDIPAEIVESLCVRLVGPNDVRGFASWRNRRWDCAWLVGPAGFERHGARSIVDRVRSAIVDSSLTNA